MHLIYLLINCNTMSCCRIIPTLPRYNNSQERKRRVFHHFPSNTFVECSPGQGERLAYPGSTLVLNNSCNVMNCDERQATSEGCNSSTGSGYSSPPSYQPPYQ